MLKSTNHMPLATVAPPSKIEVIDFALAELTIQLERLDNAGLSMASIHLNNAIETLRADRERLRNGA